MKHRSIFKKLGIILSLGFALSIMPSRCLRSDPRSDLVWFVKMMQKYYHKTFCSPPGFVPKQAFAIVVSYIHAHGKDRITEADISAALSEAYPCTEKPDKITSVNIDTTGAQAPGSLVFRHNPAEEHAALIAAKDWLKVLDDGEYETAWNQTSSMFRLAKNKDQWMAQGRELSTVLGKNLSRNLLSANFGTLPPFPDHFVVFHFQSSYQKKDTAFENLTMTKISEKWVPNGYGVALTKPEEPKAAP